MRRAILGSVILPIALAWCLLILTALAFGSFLNVCISRLPEHRSIVHPGSRCPRCGAAILPRDNVPLLSWLLLRGRCRQCREPISPRYPLVELAYAALVAGAFFLYGFTETALAAAVFCFLALGLLVTDLETMLLPDTLTLPGLALGLSFAALVPNPELHFSTTALAHRALSACVWAGLVLLIRYGYYAVRRQHGLGLGDAKLCAMLAAWLGSRRMAVAFFVAVTVGALVGLVLAGMNRARSRRAASATSWRTLRLPLGAFLCGGGLYAWFWGEPTLKYYFSFWP